MTVANDAAYRLYHRLGFRLKKEFAAHAWVRPPGPHRAPALTSAPALLLLAASAYGPVVVVAPEGPPSAETAWIGEAVADALPRDLGLLTVPAVDRADLRQTLERLGIPGAPVTRASAIRVAEALSASRLVTGSYVSEDEQVTLSLRLLDVERATLSAPLIAKGPLARLPELIARSRLGHRPGRLHPPGDEPRGVPGTRAGRTPRRAAGLCASLVRLRPGRARQAPPARARPPPRLRRGAPGPRATAGRDPGVRRRAREPHTHSPGLARRSHGALPRGRGPPRPRPLRRGE